MPFWSETQETEAQEESVAHAITASEMTRERRRWQYRRPSGPFAVREDWLRPSNVVTLRVSDRYL